MHQLTTNKLFYNKYKYKVECFIFGANFRNSLGIVSTNSKYNIVELRKFNAAVDRLMDLDIKTRNERNTVSFFFNDQSLEPTIKKAIGNWIVSITSPGSDAESEFLEGSRQKILCNNLPREVYRYKAYLKPSTSVANRAKFLTWSDKIGDVVFHSGSTSRWLSGTNVYYPDPFIYVKDDKNLSMVLMFLGNDCRKVVEYIPRSSINT
jgi:hypothetical protein